MTRLAPTYVQSILLGRLLPALIWSVISYPAFRVLFQGGPAGTAELLRRGLSVVFATLVILLFLLRRPRRGERAGLLSTLVAFAGTFSFLTLTGAPLVHDDPVLLAAGDIVALAALLWSMVALAALGRCFGIRPAARGLVTSGPYRLVRHPLYLGELVFGLGTLLPILSPVTTFTWFLGAGLQARRAINEEQVLSAAFPAYHDYRARTNFLIPFLW